jgi:serine/threonine protein kinase
MRYLPATSVPSANIESDRNTLQTREEPCLGDGRLFAYDPSVVEDGAILGGKYRVGRPLGKGGMAVVFEAMHQQLGTLVAVKVLRDDLAKNQEVADRFLREARAAAALRGDHICRVIDFGTHEDGTPYIVMELLEGRDLASVLRDQDQIEVGLAASYMLHACAAVAELHSQGMVHRDLKPGNLFVVQKLDGSPSVKILDFGIAKVVLPVDFDLTSTANIMGSPAYMSPEQLRSAKNVDARSDIWSLGIVLYELVTGDKPFDGESITDLALAITTEPPRPMPRNVPTGFIEVVWKCLEKEVAKRFQNVGELAEALQPFAGTKQELATSVGRVLASPKVQATATPKEKTTLGSASGVMLVRPSAKPLIWIGAVLGAAVIAFVIALSIGGKDDAPTPSPAAAPPVAKPAPTPPPPQPVTVPPAPPDASVAVSPPDAAEAPPDAAEVAAPTPPEPPVDKPHVPKKGKRTQPAHKGTKDLGDSRY